MVSGRAIKILRLLKELNITKAKAKDLSNALSPIISASIRESSGRKLSPQKRRIVSFLEDLEAAADAIWIG